MFRQVGDISLRNSHLPNPYGSFSLVYWFLIYQHDLPTISVLHQSTTDSCNAESHEISGKICLTLNIAKCKCGCNEYSLWQLLCYYIILLCQDFIVLVRVFSACYMSLLYKSCIVLEVKCNLYPCKSVLWQLLTLAAANTGRTAYV